MKNSLNQNYAAFAAEATTDQVAAQLVQFNIATGNGVYIAETAHNTAVMVTRRVATTKHVDVIPSGYLHQVDALVSTKVIKYDGQFEGVGKLDLSAAADDFMDDYTVIALFDDEAVIIEVVPFEGATVVDRFRNYAHTNLYREVELTDL